MTYFQTEKSQSKYFKWYFQIVERAQQRTLGVYTENHHIVPTSLGGANTKSNKVKLTAREHFICHFLLVKLTEGEDRAKMAYALHRMLLSKNDAQPRYQCSSRLYQTFREENAKWRKIHATGRKLSEDAKRRIGEATSSRVGPNKGKKFSEETRLKMSLARLGTKMHPKTREAIRNSRLGATNSDHQKEVARQTMIKYNSSKIPESNTKTVVAFKSQWNMLPLDRNR
jgi:hypothetical protein